MASPKIETLRGVFVAKVHREAMDLLLEKDLSLTILDQGISVYTAQDLLTEIARHTFDPVPEQVEIDCLITTLSEMEPTDLIFI